MEDFSNYTEKCDEFENSQNFQKLVPINQEKQWKYFLNILHKIQDIVHKPLPQVRIVFATAPAKWHTPIKKMAHPYKENGSPL